jgi:hypothetical protein
MPSQRLRQPLAKDLGAVPKSEAACRSHLLSCDKGFVRHLEEVDAAEHLDETDAIVRPFLDGEVETPQSNADFRAAWRIVLR